jgi:hypothetical protein
MMFRDKSYKPKGLRDNIGFTGYLRINPSIIPDGRLTLGEQQRIRRRDIPKAKGTITVRSLSKPGPKKLSEEQRNKKVYEEEQALLRRKDVKDRARKDYYAQKTIRSEPAKVVDKNSSSKVKIPFYARVIDKLQKK